MHKKKTYALNWGGYIFHPTGRALTTTETHLPNKCLHDKKTHVTFPQQWILLDNWTNKQTNFIAHNAQHQSHLWLQSNTNDEGIQSNSSLIHKHKYTADSQENIDENHFNNVDNQQWTEQNGVLLHRELNYTQVGVISNLGYKQGGWTEGNTGTKTQWI